jgi:sarcosine oxidase subunit alpha
VLVGLKPVDRSLRLNAGAHFLDHGAAPSFETDQGYMTSVACSPMLGHWIGLGFLVRGRERHGQRVRAYDPIRGKDTDVEVVSPYYFDPDGTRLKT